MTTGLDTSILCYCLDPVFPEHVHVESLLLGLSSTNRVAVNPTILHESYHVLVFSQKFILSEAKQRLLLLLQHPYVDFHNHTKSVCLVALSIAEKYGFGGRDSLIIANFLCNNVETMYTHDEELLSLQEVDWKNRTLSFTDPVVKQRTESLDHA